MDNYNFTFGNLILPLVVTIMAYMIVPVVLRMTRDEAYSKKEANKISIINSIIVAIIFFVLREIVGDVENNAISVAPAFLYYGINLSLLQWDLVQRNYTYLFMIFSLISCIFGWFVGALLFGFVAFVFAFGGLRLSGIKGSWQRLVLYIEAFLGLFIFFSYLHSITLNIGIPYVWGFIYALLCMIIFHFSIFKKQIININHNDTCNNEEDFTIIKTLYCKVCGSKLNQNKKCTKCGKQYFKFNKSLMLYLITGVLVISNAITIFMYVNKNEQLEDIIYNYEEKESWCETKMDMLTNGQSWTYVSDKLDFFDENIVFVIEGYGNYYYTYDCVQKITDGEEYSYWAYNKEAAKVKGYQKGTCY